MSFSTDKEIEKILLEYKIECQQAYLDYKYSTIDNFVLESEKTPEDSSVEQSNFRRYLNRLKSAKDKMIRKITRKKIEEPAPEVKNKKVKLRFNLKKIKSEIDDDSKTIEKNKRIITTDPNPSKKIKRLDNDQTQFLANNAVTIVSAGVATADMIAAQKSIDDMSKKFDIACGTYEKLSSGEQRSAAMVASQESSAKIGIYTSILMDAEKDIKF